jgi:plasmid maintenance system antidote protein VapI
MSITPSAMQEEMQNISQFQRLSKTLLSPRYREYLDKPLAYWILPTDRRLPLSFLSRNLGDLLNATYEDLAKTPGIGRKKMAALVNLFARAAETDPEDISTINPALMIAAEPWQGTARSSTANLPSGFASDSDSSPNGFDFATVSEVQWERWRETIVRHGLCNENLGRFAPSLRNVTKVIWNSPLSVFVGHTLAELRSMKTFGDKRIQAILEVFHGLHSLLAGLGCQPHLKVRISPCLFDRIEQWVGRSLQTPGIPSEDEISSNFIQPLLRQIEIDAMPQLITLAENRLGILGPVRSVRQTARIMGLTRARVYQLLNEINDIASVRWPLGRHMVYELRQKFERESAETNPSPNLTQFLAAVEIIFPGNRRGADGPLDFIDDDFAEEDADLLEV